MYIPNRIKEIINNQIYSLNETGMSKAQVICFDEMILKIEKQSEESDTEYKMMEWLSDKLPVPKIICSEKDNGINYLLMSRVDGEMACSSEMLKNPENLTRILADGLRMLWNVDISDYPYNNSIDNKLRLAEMRVKNGLCSIEDAEQTTFGVNGFENPEKLLEWLKANKPVEELTFSHGDFCLPNILIKDNQISGFIDLGRSGVADIYQDIALCYRSLKHNLNGKYGGKVYDDFEAKILFDKLKINPDWNKIEYFILLDELF